MINYQKQIHKINNTYKNTKLLLDIYLENYHNFNIYIRLDYDKKRKVYLLSWCNLNTYNNENTISHEYLNIDEVTKIEKIIDNINSYEYLESDTCIVNINNYFSNKLITYKFNRYIPKELSGLFNIMVIIFDNLPLKLNSLLQELSAKIIGNTSKFEYHEPINFDLFKDNLDKLFPSEIRSRGLEYYNNHRIFFLEQLGDTYFALVGGSELYVITIKYNETNKIMQVNCSCPCTFHCKHIYAVILAIRNHEFKKFYKITHKSDDINLLDRVMNFNFFLCIGIDDQGINYLVIQDDIIKLLPILNTSGKSEWQILEDDEFDTLTKRLEEILK